MQLPEELDRVAAIRLEAAHLREQVRQQLRDELDRRSRVFAAALGETISHKRTRPYRPQTNGKVERFNRTMLQEWAYARPYLSERAVGCLAVAQGWQSGVSTLGTLRTIVHALRGWPTPLGVVLNTSVSGFTADGDCADPQVREQIEVMARQVVDFARTRPPRP